MVSNGRIPNSASPKPILLELITGSGAKKGDGYLLHIPLSLQGDWKDSAEGTRKLHEKADQIRRNIERLLPPSHGPGDECVQKTEDGPNQVFLHVRTSHNTARVIAKHIKLDPHLTRDVEIRPPHSPAVDEESAAALRCSPASIVKVSPGEYSVQAMIHLNDALHHSDEGASRLASAAEIIGNAAATGLLFYSGAQASVDGNACSVSVPAGRYSDAKAIAEALPDQISNLTDAEIPSSLRRTASNGSIRTSFRIG